MQPVSLDVWLDYLTQGHVDALRSTSVNCALEIIENVEVYASPQTKRYRLRFLPREKCYCGLPTCCIRQITSRHVHKH